MSFRFPAGLLLAATLFGTGCELPRAEPTLTPRGRLALSANASERREAARSAGHRSIRALVAEHRWSVDASEADALADLVWLEARRAGVDPLMVAAVIARESSFRTGAVSGKGAIGLMQIRPFVARDLALRAGIDWDGPAMLQRPEVNVRLGVMYLRELVEEFGDARVALSAYHRGPARVRGQIRRGTFGPGRYAEAVLRLRANLEARAAALATPPATARAASPSSLRAG